MALKNRQTIHRTAKGKVVDMDMLRAKNELTPAVGNVRVNARGDELGPGGQIVRSRNEVLKEYYDDNVQTVADEQRAPAPKQEVQEEQPAPAKTTSSRSRAQKKVEEVVNEPTAAELAEFEDDEWVEDENGDFVKKGE